MNAANALVFIQLFSIASEVFLSITTAISKFNANNGEFTEEERKQIDEGIALLKERAKKIKKLAKGIS